MKNFIDLVFAFEELGREDLQQVLKTSLKEFLDNGKKQGFTS